jgi:hypothetical protein
MEIKNKDITTYIGHWNHRTKTTGRAIRMFQAVL